MPPKSAKPAKSSAKSVRSASFIARHPTLTGLIAALVFGVITLALAEAVLRVLAYQKAEAFFAAHLLPENESGIDDPAAFYKETLNAYANNLLPHPHRWYQFKPDLSGTYFQTQGQGFRVNPPVPGVAEDAPVIGMFGGSTMFSVSTVGEYSIPALMQQMCPGARVINYGMGGYSSTAELMTLAEVIRTQPLAAAVFYDGVNEVGRYVELLQNQGDKPNNPFHAMGFPYHDPRVKVLAYSQSLESRYPIIQSLYLAKLVSKAALATGLAQVYPYREDKLADTPEKMAAHADRIAAIYLHNVRQIRALAGAYGTHASFFYQPNLFIKAAPSDKEKQLLAEASPVQRGLHAALDSRDWKSHGIINLAGIIGDNPATVYNDVVHGGKTLNTAVAVAMLKADPRLAKLCKVN
jgi:hypothetical protein